jgi:nucleotide-binding universal stress UspA family protein
VFERIVAALDVDPERSAAVLQAARELGVALKSTVLVVHVQELERPAALAGAGRPGLLPAPLSAGEAADASRALVDQAVTELVALGVAAEGRVQAADGSTAKELLDIASEFGATLIIVGDRGSRVTDILLGSVAHKVVHSAACPVLLVRGSAR